MRKDNVIDRSDIGKYKIFLEVVGRMPAIVDDRFPHPLPAYPLSPLPSGKALSTFAYHAGRRG